MIRFGALVVGVLLAAVLALTGCSHQGSVAPGVRPRAAPASSALRDLAFPADTLQDWVTYGDGVVAVRIDSDRRRPPTEEEMQLGRVSTFRQVTWSRGEVLWSNPTRPDEDVPATQLTHGGEWSSEADDAVPQPSGGDPVLVVGHTYLAVLAHTTLGGGTEPREWVPMALLPFDDGLVGAGETYRGWEGQEATLDAVWGRTGAEVVALLKSTPVKPAARPYADRDAAPKYQLAAR